ncbi:MAG: hypothetical protein KJ727_09520 [Acidobacteria bacterium]|nr:hypothetical protein [Acidobacteriota bacterium]MBU4254818.1 hypothetical protein [Acidobacteriota bacterium]MBU4330238.1 hypothetical protein [Acidobacteriota bacterium]
MTVYNLISFCGIFLLMAIAGTFVAGGSILLGYYPGGSKYRPISTPTLNNPDFFHISSVRLRKTGT